MKTSQAPDNFSGINADNFSLGKTFEIICNARSSFSAMKDRNNHIFIADIKISIRCREDADLHTPNDLAWETQQYLIACHLVNALF